MEKLSTFEMVGIGLAAVLIYLNYSGNGSVAQAASPAAVASGAAPTTGVLPDMRLHLAQGQIPIVATTPSGAVAPGSELENNLAQGSASEDDIELAAYDPSSAWRTGKLAMYLGQWNQARQVYGGKHGNAAVPLVPAGAVGQYQNLMAGDYHQLLRAAGAE